MTRTVWRYIRLVWMSLSGVSLSSLSRIFAYMENNELMPHFKFIFEFLRYLGLWFNWNMRNAFTFDLQVGMRKYVVNLKGVCLWQLTVLEKSRNLDHEDSRERAMQGHISSYLPLELVCRVALSLES